MTEHDGELLRGKGPGLGPLALSFPQSERTMLHVLRRQSELRPDRQWMRFDDRDSLTFGQAYELANQVAHAILRDVGSGCHVGLFLTNQWEFFPAFYGAMAAGGVPVPLNADSQGRLLQHLVVTSDIRILICRTELLGRFAELESMGLLELIVAVGEGERPTDVQGVPVVAFDGWFTSLPVEAPLPLPDSSDVGLIMFTSGTTGNSKGVIYPHHFVYMYSVATADSVGFTPEDVLFASTPLYHALALHTISNAALHAGAQAHLRSKFSASAFWDQVVAAGTTYMVLLGPMAQIIGKTVESAPAHKVKLIYCPPYPPNGDEFTERFKVKIVWQGYGMTEIFPNPYFDHDPEGVPRDSAGFPASWVDYGIVDEHDRPLPFGAIGQLVFRPRITDAMARGYYKAPEATVTAFANNMFHTGDLASTDESGRIYYKGRMNDRIRRMGENVSAAELEETAAGHPDVIEAAAYAVPGEFGEDEIKLDVIVRTSTLTPAELHAWLVERLPRFMIPRYFELCADLPKTPSGKIEKHKLSIRGTVRPEVVEIAPTRRK